MASLVLKFNDKVLRECPLDRPQLWIGRKPKNDVVIENAAVSGEHARVVCEDGVYYIEDMASTNGTYLNEERVERRALYDGDKIRVGKHLLVFQDATRRRERRPSLEA